LDTQKTTAYGTTGEFEHKESLQQPSKTLDNSFDEDHQEIVDSHTPSTKKEQKNSKLQEKGRCCQLKTSKKRKGNHAAKTTV